MAVTENGMDYASMLAQTSSGVETERALRDASESRFAFYCSLMLLVGILLGALLGQAFGAARAQTLVPIEKTTFIPQKPPVLALRSSLISRTHKTSYQDSESAQAESSRRLAKFRLPFRLTLRGQAEKPISALADAPAWKASSSAAVKLPDHTPLIAIVIDDMGPVRRATERALRLPSEVTLSFLPGARGVQDFARRARAGGHEILIHMPMEPEGAVNPGRHALMVSQSTTDIERELSWAFARLSGYVGINNHMGSRFSHDRAGMETVLKKIKANGLAYLDSRTSAASMAPEIAREIGIPFAVRDVFLDDKFDTSTILARLKQTEAIARRKGSAIAIAHPRDHSLDTLEVWLQTVAQRGLAVVPLTAVINKRREGQMHLAAAG